MIEDVDLTRQILEHFASDDVGWPADATLESLATVFPEVDRDTLAYHIQCAAEAGLLEADVNKLSTDDGTIVTIGWIVGLTQIGGEYVKDSRSEFYDKAFNHLKEAGISATTDRLKQVMSNLITAVLGSLG